MSGDVLVVDTIAAPVLIAVDFNMTSELKYDNKHVFERSRMFVSLWFAYVIPSLLIMMG